MTSLYAESKESGTKEVTYETDRDSQRTTPWLLQKVMYTLLYLNGCWVACNVCPFPWREDCHQRALSGTKLMPLSLRLGRRVPYGLAW